jgi:hypothetical protein
MEPVIYQQIPEEGQNEATPDTILQAAESMKEK